MTKLFTSAHIIFAALAVGFLAALATQPSGGRAGPNLRVDQETRSVGNVLLRADFVVEFRLTNLGTRTVTVTGSKASCSRTACLDVADLPTRISAGERKKIAVHVKTRGGGHLADQLILFTDDAEQSEIALGVEGRVIEGPIGVDAPDWTGIGLAPAERRIHP